MWNLAPGLRLVRWPGCSFLSQKVMSRQLTVLPPFIVQASLYIRYNPQNRDSGSIQSCPKNSTEEHREYTDSLVSSISTCVKTKTPNHYLSLYQLLAYLAMLKGMCFFLFLLHIQSLKKQWFSCTKYHLMKKRNPPHFCTV